MGTVCAKQGFLSLEIHIKELRFLSNEGILPAPHPLVYRHGQPGPSKILQIFIFGGVRAGGSENPCRNIGRANWFMKSCMKTDSIWSSKRETDAKKHFDGRSQGHKVSQEVSTESEGFLLCSALD